MCSIIGYSGKHDAARILINGLRRMEYRGYDSVGIATKHGKEILIKKGTGRVDYVNNIIKLDEMPGILGIGHTRWATQGAPTDLNAHPHSSSGKRVAIVHNGSIDNFMELKASLELRGFTFKSQTDSEVIANLLESELDGQGGIRGALERTIKTLEGHYTFVAIFEDGSLAAARNRESLIIGVGEDNEYYISSDVYGFIEYTDNVIYVNDNHIIIIDEDGLCIYDEQGNTIPAKITKVSRELADIYKGDYTHYTNKEISEQPDIIEAAGGNESNIIEAAKAIRKAKTVYIVGSGTSYNAALVGKYMLAKYASIRAETVVASEVRVNSKSFAHDGVLLAISQSGESADILEAVRIAHNVGLDIISIVNHPNSALGRESTNIIRMNCGLEIGVAATKSFISQLVVLFRIIAKLGGPIVKPKLISSAISAALEMRAGTKKIAATLQDVNNVYILGRGMHYAIASEAALKLKELTYIHAEAILGGEIKHGPLALMDSNTRVIVINPPGPTHSDVLSDAAKIRARGAHIIGIDTTNANVYDDWIQIPQTDELTYMIVEIIPIQLLAYYTALEKNTDPDHPRNLAKSVTVR